MTKQLNKQELTDKINFLSNEAKSFHGWSEVIAKKHVVNLALELQTTIEQLQQENKRLAAIIAKEDNK